MALIKWGLRWLFLCKLLGLHKWSARVTRGEKINGPIVSSLHLLHSIYAYSRLTCDCCGVEAKASKDFWIKINKPNADFWN
jgi:hypothetical protein